MLEGYKDLRNELTEIFGGQVSEEDIDAAVEALVNEEHVTATPALAELNALAQSPEGKVKLRTMLADWIMHERQRQDSDREQKAVAALNHLLAAVGGERRDHTAPVEKERRH